MSLDDAIKKISDVIKTASGGAEVRAVKISEEEARLSVYAAADDMQAVKDAPPLKG
jgi:hypothetical protein